MVYYSSRFTPQNEHYNDYRPQTTQESGYSPSNLFPPPTPNTSSRDPQHDTRRTYPPQPQRRIQRSYSPLPKPPIGPTQDSRAPSPTPPRPPPRAQTYPSVNLHARGNSTFHGSEGKKSQGNPEQEDRARSSRRGVQYEEIKKDGERRKKPEEKRRERETRDQRKYNSEKEKLNYRKRVERDRNRPVDRPEVRPSRRSREGSSLGGAEGSRFAWLVACGICIAW
ncbi:uncharacterized protein EAE98_008659 [Botrytis deweyae]|uniref:Uncharacterized protein n=1 Tax=Botrytis deweyae TaxID=2478750 RepID=A0ABQ7IDS4_9HELO|nr:uncharacterized protein EAE98_008659 [Botrytis deweyae]KAF7921233.1 hypothetical protein EAE98_008659 [Botrytis deweyae]